MIFSILIEINKFGLWCKTLYICCKFFKIIFKSNKNLANMNNELNAVILNLWAISRTALAGQINAPTRYERMIYVKTELIRSHKDLISRLSPKHIWFAIEDAIN